MIRPCTVRLTLDFDFIGCDLEEGHAGPHRDDGEGGVFYWYPEETNADS